MDDDRRMAAAVKPEDGFFATFVVASYSPYVVRWAARRRVTPNQVTAASVVLAFAAAAAFATGGRAAMVVGAVLVQLAFAADCVDGQLARYTAATSALGGWLDAVSDRIKELAIYAGLAIGGARGGDDGVWVLAACAVALQAVRHQLVFAYDVRYDGAADGPSSVVDHVDGPARQLGAAGVRTARALERSWLKWVKRIVVLPIGERFALISVTAVLGGPRAVFVALLVWGAVAATYATAGRVLRSLDGGRASQSTGHGDTVPTRGPDAVAPLMALRDDGPLALALRRLAPRGVPAVAATLLGGVALAVGAAVDGADTGPGSLLGVGLFVVLGALSGGGRPDGPVGWLVPPLLHAGEYVTFVVLAWRADAVPAAFLLLVVVASHHYEVLQVRGAVRLPRRTDLLAGGWDGRMLLMTAAAVSGAVAGTAVALAAWAGTLFGIASAQQVRALVRDTTEAA